MSMSLEIIKRYIRLSTAQDIWKTNRTKVVSTTRKVWRRLLKQQPHKVVLQDLSRQLLLVLKFKFTL
ncbi:hypothetical protein Lal_00044660 [Lupinus albus]|nr:hypothetical protein Lal_00044660 [Lupinus albus]